MQNNMATAEVMRAGVRTALALLLNEISTLLEKSEDNENLGIWIRKRNRLGQSM